MWATLRAPVNRRCGSQYEDGGCFRPTADINVFANSNDYERGMGKMAWRVGMSVVLLLAVGWVGMTYAAAERGTPLCLSKLRFASRESVIRQGAWSYMLNKEPSERAARGEEGQSYIPTTTLDVARVDRFLREHPNCCRIQPLEMSDSTVSRAISRAMFPNLTYVEVKARPQRPVLYFDVYKVDACWENLARRQ